MNDVAWNPVVNCELSFSIFWRGERLDVPALGLLSSVMGVASRSLAAFPPAAVAPEHDAALPVSCQSPPPSACVLNVDGFSWVTGEPVCDMLGRAVLSLRMKLSLVTWVCTLVGVGHEFAGCRLSTMRCLLA